MDITIELLEERKKELEQEFLTLENPIDRAYNMGERGMLADLMLLILKDEVKDLQNGLKESENSLFKLLGDAFNPADKLEKF